MHISMPSNFQETPAIHVPYDQWNRESTALVVTQSMARAFAPSGTAEDAIPTPSYFGDITGITQATREQAAPEQEPGANSDDRDVRLRLLARKYGRSRFSIEDEARLEILTTRLRKVIVRVTEQDIEVLESINRDIEASRELREQLQSQYGI